MKKIIALVLAILMAVSMIACNQIEFACGTIDGNVYTNDFLGFSFEKPEKWVYWTEEEVTAEFNFQLKYFLDVDDSTREELEKTVASYDMVVEDKYTDTSVIVLCEPLESPIIPEFLYVESFKQQLENDSAYDDVEYGKATFGKKKFSKAEYVTTLNGITVTQAIYIRKVDKYLAMIIVTIPVGYTVADIEAMFK